MESENLPPLEPDSGERKNGRMKTLLFIFLVSTLMACHKTAGENSVSDSTQTPVETQPSSTWTEEFMELVNDHRVSLGLRPLIHSDALAQIVVQHSQNMARGSVAFGHTGFSVRCSEGRNALGGGNWCGENVAMGQKTPQAAFQSWMNSSGHRANIEQNRATHTGFGYAQSSGGTYYWTQIFIEL